VHGPEFLSVQAVHTASAFPHDADEADLAEHAQVLGHLGLRPAQLLDEPGDISLFLAAGEDAEELAPARLRDGVEGVGGGRPACHGLNIFPYWHMSRRDAFMPSKIPRASRDNPGAQTASLSRDRTYGRAVTLSAR